MLEHNFPVRGWITPPGTLGLNSVMTCRPLHRLIDAPIAPGHRSSRSTHLLRCSSDGHFNCDPKDLRTNTNVHGACARNDRLALVGQGTAFGCLERPNC